MTICPYKRDNEADCSRCGIGPCNYNKVTPLHPGFVEAAKHAVAEATGQIIDVEVDASSGMMNMNALVLLYGTIKGSNNVKKLQAFADIAVKFAKGIDAACDLLAPYTQWVKISDELPPEREKVLCWHPLHGNALGVCVYKAWIVDWDEAPYNVHPSHWCKLIAPPK